MFESRSSLYLLLVFMVFILEPTGASKIVLEIFIDVLLIYRKPEDPPQGLSRPFRNSKESGCRDRQSAGRSVVG